MKRKENYRFAVPGASIILIFLVFSLTVFAVLSIRASYHELKLSEKTRKSVEDYYKADAEAEEILGQVDDELEKYSGKNSSINRKDLSKALLKINGVTEALEKGDNLSYEVKINDSSVIRVKLGLNIKGKKNKKFDILSWKMVTMEQG